MAENNAAETNVQPKPPTKMDLAKTLYAELTAETAVIPEGSSIRKEFIRRGQDEIGLTRAGAITYYNNLQTHARGGSLYVKPKSKKTVAEAQGQAADTPMPVTEEQAAGDAIADAALAEDEQKTEE